MPKLRVHNFAISLDGYAAGPNQDVDNPLGVGGPRLHEWGPIVIGKLIKSVFRQVSVGNKRQAAHTCFIQSA